MVYQSRIIEAEIQAGLENVGAVVIEGPRGCGKTETARQFSRSEVLLDGLSGSYEVAGVDPGILLEGPIPRLLDEWQLAPALWNAVRRRVDSDQRKGQFVLTGSASADNDPARHPGSLRFLRIAMRPMSLRESRGGEAPVSMAGLFSGNFYNVQEAGMDAREYLEAIVRGGWPGLQNIALTSASSLLTSYIQDIAQIDAKKNLETRKRPEFLLTLARSLARNVSTEAGPGVLLADLRPSEGDVHPDTLRRYLGLLESLRIVERQPAWLPHLRSASAPRKSSKIHFVDPSLAVASMGATIDTLLGDPRFVGLLFESLAVRDIRIYSQALGGRVSHYRDSDGLEVDAIVSCGEGTWIACEIKMGSGALDGAAKNLLRFREKVDTTRVGVPAELVVITTGDFSYRREDGVLVIPLSHLGS